MIRASFAVLFFISAAALAVDFPPYIFKCTRQSINQECGPDSANAALPQLLRGSEELGIPSFFPFKIPSLNFDSPQIQMKLSNCELGDFSTLQVMRTSWQPPLFAARVQMEKVTLTGEFGEGTQVFGANLPRSGKANFTLGHVIIDLEATNTRNALDNFEETYTIDSVQVRIKPFTKNYKLSELWTGTPYLEVTDSDILSAAVYPHIEKAIEEAYKAIMGPIQQFTLNTIFRSALPQLPPLQSYLNRG